MKKSLKMLVVILLVLALLVGAAVIAGNHFLNKENMPETTTVNAESSESDSSDSPEVLNPEDVEWNDKDFNHQNDEKLINILLVGQDRREGEERQRSDAMILCSFNPEANKLSMISFLRDLYVQIPGYSDNRLNAAYAFGGFPLLKQTLNTNFGITVDGCLEADFFGFEKIIDTVGGVDIELTSAEAEIVGNGATAGLCHLDGEQTLMYARIRKIDSDFQRTARQRNVMNAVFEKVKNCSLTELAVFVNEIMPLLTTDMTDEDLMSFAATIYASSFAELETESYSIPSDGNYKNATINGMAVLVPDLYAIKKIIFEEYLPF